VRFVLDQDVPASVRTMLTREGHDAWLASEAGLSRAEDDDLTVYAARHAAVLVSFDVEFMQRRSANAIGRHIRLRCAEPEAAEVLRGRLKEVLEYLEREHVTVTVSRDAVKADSHWGESRKTGRRRRLSER
jgi:predicted nuclease of predicted toxin-antitoxin system